MGYDSGYNSGYDSLDSWGLGNSPGCSLLTYSHAVPQSATITTCIPGPYPTTDDYTTVWTTEYIQVCPTETPCPHGTTTETYTITETCNGNKNDYTRPPIPPHFTTSVTVCDVCEGKPTITVTCPYATETGYKGSQSVDNNSGVQNGYPNVYNNGTDTYKKYEGYIASSIASNGRTEIAAALFGSFIGLVAWFL